MKLEITRWTTVLAAALWIASPLPAIAQTDAAADAAEEEEEVVEVGKWYPGLEAGVTLTQSSYSDNWSGGDRGSIVWTAIAKGTLERRFSEKFHWNNALKLAYGQTHQQSEGDGGDLTWDQPQKSTDLVDYESLLRATLGGFVDPFVGFQFESQFLDASDPEGRTLSLNPLRFKESAGIARQFIQEEDQSLLSRVGFALRQTARRIFVAEPPSTETENETTNDGGIEWVTDYTTKILEDRVSWTSKLTVFQPLFYSAQDQFDDLTPDQLMAARLDSDIADFTTVADIDFENIFTTQITKIISVNLYVRWLYDKYENSVTPILNDDGTITNAPALRAAVRKAGQFKQTLSIGLTYRLL